MNEINLLLNYWNDVCVERIVCEKTDKNEINTFDNEHENNINQCLKINIIL